MSSTIAKAAGSQLAVTATTSTVSAITGQTITFTASPTGGADGPYTIQADTQGSIRVLQGVAPTRDGDIKIGHDLLADGIRTGRSPPPNSYQVAFYTQKGRAAFGQLKSSFGL